MPLKPGTRLGTYEVLAMIGAGGMGEVYKARDAKLDRMVALKLLPAALASDAALLARFDREAKAVAALSHPNILGIFDLATQDGHTYAVMELLEGESLRDRLRGGALPPRRAVELAIELAQGLGAAHARGIVHRDVKPENIFLTLDGRVKVLDFGLAKQVQPQGAGAELDTAAMSAHGTEAGMILGTVGYMSPEQVKGEPAGPAADVFAFGVVLYEMLSGERPFRGETSIQTMSAILEADPPPLASPRGPLPPALERLVAHCLEKQAGGRFQSMKDIAFALQNLGTAGSEPPGAARAARVRRLSWPQLGLGAAATLVLAALAWAFHLPPFSPQTPPTFTRLTFAPGTVDTACFGPDGRTVYFSARVAGAKPEIFSLHPGDEEPKALGLQDALLLGVSPANEVFLLRHPVQKISGLQRGLLAQVPAGGGATKDLQEEVLSAAGDGQGLAALMTINDRNRIRIEFPMGTTQIEADGTIIDFRRLRLAPDGQHLALVAHNNTSDATLETLDRAGLRQVRYTRVGDNNGDTLTGLAWGPGGELWFTELQGDQTELWALPDSGRRRLLWRGQGHLELMDAAPDGRALLAAHQVRRGTLVQRAGETQARDVSLRSGTQIHGLSADGSRLLLLESPALDGGTAQDRTFLRPADGGPALHLARGNPRTLSPDGRWVYLSLTGQAPGSVDPALAGALREAGLDLARVLDPKTPQQGLLFLPTGAGRPWVLALPSKFTDADSARLLPDGQRVAFLGNTSELNGWFLMDRNGGPPRALTPQGYDSMPAGLAPLSPDGSQLIVTGNLKEWFVVPVPPAAGPALRPIKGILPGERLLGWAADNRCVYVRPELSVLPVTIHKVDTFTGARTLVQALAPPDRAGHLETRNVYLTPDARTFAFDFDRKLSELYLVEGLK